MPVNPDMLVPLAVGLGVSGLVLAALWWFGRRKSSAGLGNAPDLGTLLQRSSDWELPPSSFADRRTAKRREGVPVKVLLSSPAFKRGVTTGYVVDRSTGGLRVVMQHAMPVGGTMLVRAANAPDTIPWVTLLIRSCRANGEYHEIGCEFDKTPPWNVLLLFG